MSFKVYWHPIFPLINVCGTDHNVHLRSRGRELMLPGILESEHETRALIGKNAVNFFCHGSYSLELRELEPSCF